MIRILPDHLINQICAGEVSDRPATILKELIENSLDAEATEIKINTEEGGKNKLTIADNGKGMPREDLEKSILRHATSKIPDEDLFNICSFGFRGEALASIASASRMKITTSNNESSWEMIVASGKILSIKPSARSHGTTIEITDLFYAIPARLKFLRSTRAEQGAINEIVKRFAIGNPTIKLQLNNLLFEKTDLTNRAKKILGADFIANSLSISNSIEDYSISGLIGKPTYYKHNSRSFFVFVNGRFLKDKFLFAILRQCYFDVMAYDRYPVLVLNLKVPESEIDVNVHPAKTEVKFRNQAILKQLIIGTIKRELGKTTFENHVFSTVKTADAGISEIKETPFSYPQASFAGGKISDEDIILESDISSQFGIARFQLHNTYIISQSQDGWFIIDQHASHERIVLEKIQSRKIIRQQLLLPEIFISTPEAIEKLLLEKKSFAETGFVIEQIDETKIAIKEIPAFLKYITPIELFQKISAELETNDIAKEHQKIIHKIRGTIACHGSIRAGQSLSIPEMNELLKQIGETPRAMQCNHGRPTVMKLDRKLLDKIFERG
ncbi:MAG: DNA mismatch repair endonuclease MutL [Alphaproteobacteria bacterium]